MTKPVIEMTAGDSGYEARISGDWTLPNAAEIEQQIGVAQKHAADATSHLNLAALNKLDTTGGLILLRLLGEPGPR